MNSPKGHSNTVTEGIRVRVGAEFLPDRSSPDQDYFLFRYRVILENEGDQPARLLSRHWVILDAHNGREEVRGPGVVGHTPYLAPGHQFEYESTCPLQTPWGTMEGTYQMTRDDGSPFDVEVGRFFLAATAAPISAMDATH